MTRPFALETVAELLESEKQLRRAVKFGSTSSLQLSGIRTDTNSLNPEQTKELHRQVVYEIYLRGIGIDGREADAQCADLVPRSPYTSKVMRVETRNP
jgi:hypothetical protein